MLRPQDGPTRERKRLDGLWRFRVDTDGVGHDERWMDAPLADAMPMAVPASYNDVLVDRPTREHIGTVWYDTDVWVPAGWAGRRVAITFESVTHRATVWADGEQVGEHEGGYTPFEVDLTAVARAGHALRLTVEVDNRLTFQTIPPGVVVDTPAGPRQRYWHDFFNYAGIHRSVWLTGTPTTRLEDLTVVTDLDGPDGLVHCRAEIGGDGGPNPSVRAVLRDADGREVATAEGMPCTLTVPEVHPWAPGDGYLYELTVELVRDGGLLDSYRLPVGVRTVEVQGSQFLINGEPFHFTGFAMHEDIPIIGKGHHDAWMLHDFALLEWIGATSIRTSHYPYSEDVLDEADRRGIVVIDETAAVGLNMGIGGGVFGAQGYVTYSPETINAQTQATHAQAIRELVARDKNHPSVVLWSIANEPESQTQGAVDYFRPLFDVARAADPTRPVGVANVVLAPHGECRLAQFSDVIMLNRYYGWYLEPGDLANAELALERELRGWAGEGKPIIMTEYGADTLPGLHAIDGGPWTEEFQDELLAMYHRVFDRVEEVVGEQVWVFSDFTTVAGTMRVGGNRKGVFTRDRQPKRAAFTLRDRWAHPTPATETTP